MGWFLRQIDKNVKKFEYGILIAGVSGSYLNLTLYCLLQMRSIVIYDITQFTSFVLAFLIYAMELVYPFFIYKITKDIMGIEKNIKRIKNQDKFSRIQLEEQNKIKEDFSEKYGFFYELFKEDRFISAGYFLIAAIRKLIFGFVLVIFNENPVLNLCVFIINCLVIIFINLFYKPYKSNIMNYFHCVPEVLYCVIYSSSFPLLDDNIT